MRKAAPEVEVIVTALRDIGISAPYASQIARNKRTPSPTMALRIFRETGLRFGVFRGASQEETAIMREGLGQGVAA
jgi:transcriptional regulator with XRE-family HTH domain